MSRCLIVVTFLVTMYHGIDSWRDHFPLRLVVANGTRWTFVSSTESSEPLELACTVNKRRRVTANLDALFGGGSKCQRDEHRRHSRHMPSSTQTTPYERLSTQQTEPSTTPTARNAWLGFRVRCRSYNMSSLSPGCFFLPPISSCVDLVFASSIRIDTRSIPSTLQHAHTHLHCHPRLRAGSRTRQSHWRPHERSRRSYHSRPLAID